MSNKHINDACQFNAGVKCLDWDRCDKCGWRPGVEKERKSRKIYMRYRLCAPCSEKMKESYDIRKVSKVAGNKVVCDNCRRRLYGAIYDMIKKSVE